MAGRHVEDIRAELGLWKKPPKRREVKVEQ
jgi:hypothetical protein